MPANSSLLICAHSKAVLTKRPIDNVIFVLFTIHQAGKITICFFCDEPQVLANGQACDLNFGDEGLPLFL